MKRKRKKLPKRELAALSGRLIGIEQDYTMPMAVRYDLTIALIFLWKAKDRLRGQR